jgi:hypothetical protein
VVDQKDKDFANRRLKYAISALRGQAFRARPAATLHYALMVKQDLETRGLWWQAKILGHWIHRQMGGEFNNQKKPEHSTRGDSGFTDASERAKRASEASDPIEDREGS